jgi:SNF2 family DNA or RNA helicase
MKKIKSDGLIAGMGKGKGRANDDDDEMDIEDVLPSTKMKRIGESWPPVHENSLANNALGELIDYWSEVDPTQKTLIFSSFVEMLELMAVYLRKRGVKYVLYTGKLKPLEREDAIKRFIAQGVDTPTVMLISLKCGGGESFT